MWHLNVRILAGFYFLLFICLTSVSVYAKPNLSWSAESLNVEVLNGTVVVKEVSFVSANAIADLSFKISARPELASLIDIVQLTPGPVVAGGEIQLALIFTIPRNTPDGEYPGTLHIRDGKRTIARPLKIRLSVVAASASYVPVGFSEPILERIVTDPTAGVRYVVDEATVLLKENANFSAFAQAVSIHGGVIYGSDPELGLYQVRFPSVESPVVLDDLIETLANDQQVEVAMRRWEVELAAAVPPNDPAYFPPA